MGAKLILKYYKSIEENGVVHSVDMLRLKLTFYPVEQEKIKNPKWNPFEADVAEYIYRDSVYSSEKLIEQLMGLKFYMQGLDCDKWETPNDYKYRHMLVVKMEISSVTIGIGWNSGGKTDMSKGFVEFNPNKVCGCEPFDILFRQLKLACKHITLSRYDLAIDFPVKRSNLGLVKDSRKYAYEMCSIEDKTEYLGQRNKVGRVKLYNKTMESNLDSEVTRLEITVGDTKLEDVQKLIPGVTGLYSIADIDDLKGTDRVLVEALRRCDDKEVLFRMLGRGKAEKLKPYVLGEQTTYILSDNVNTKINLIIAEFLM